jgi:hypothetical protein
MYPHFVDGRPCLRGGEADYDCVRGGCQPSKLFPLHTLYILSLSCSKVHLVPIVFAEKILLEVGTANIRDVMHNGRYKHSTEM